MNKKTVQYLHGLDRICVAASIIAERTVDPEHG